MDLDEHSQTKSNRIEEAPVSLAMIRSHTQLRALVFAFVKPELACAKQVSEECLFLESQSDAATKVVSRWFRWTRKSDLKD
jgi:hypothetical protein